MYTQPHKKFRSKKPDDIERELQKIAASGTRVHRVFWLMGMR